MNIRDYVKQTVKIGRRVLKEYEHNEDRLENIDRILEGLNDETAVLVSDMFKEWETGREYTTGERVRFEDTLYKCLLNHTAQETWTPPVSPSLWVRVDDPGEEWPEWVQPVGSTDAYPLGAKVSHNEKHWISDVDGNVWEPGVYGWTEA